MKTALKPGVRWEAAAVFDECTGRSLIPRDESALLVEGFASAFLSPGEWCALVRDAIRQRSAVALVVAVRLSVRRYRPRSVAGVLSCACRVAIPATIAAGSLAIVALTIPVVIFGQLREVAVTIALGMLILNVSLTLHETAHLLTMRMFNGRDVGALERCGLSPRTLGRDGLFRSRSIAVSGPLIGALAALGLGAVIPESHGAAAIVAVFHFANLAPFAPDGRLAWA